MTSPAEVQPGVTSEPPEEQPPDATTPWTLRPMEQRSKPGKAATPTLPAAPSGASTPTAPGTSAPAVSPPASPGPVPAPSGAGVVSGPGSPAVSVAPGSAQAPPAAGAAAPPPPAPATDRATLEPEHEPSLIPGIDDQTLAQVAPAAMMGGAMALSMLPMLASALSGLAGGGNGGTGGGGNGSGATTTGDGSDAGLSPQAQKAIAALKKLAAAYGDENSDDPDVAKLRKELGTTTGNTGGTGTTANAVKARQLFQRNAATAFNTLDNDLYNYIYSHAGKHKVDKTAVRQLLRDVDAALAELGPTAFTKAGQQKVHQILTIALKKAQAIVSGGNTNSTETATEIDRLTNQYLYNIYGKKYPGGSGSKTVGGTVGQWIQQALQVLQGLGYDISRIDPEAIAIIIHYESSGNPAAVNNDDINAKNGTPSRGLMQIIQPNFDKYAAPGHKNISDPVDNIVAGVRYAIDVYGSVSNVPGVKAVRNGQAYVAY